jgi:hypothetical protein
MSRDPMWVRNIMYRARSNKDETYLTVGSGQRIAGRMQ